MEVLVEPAVACQLIFEVHLTTDMLTAKQDVSGLRKNQSTTRLTDLL